jgi:hypothetical protein
LTDAAIETADAAVETAAPESRFPGFWVSIGWIVLYFMLQGLCTAILLLTGMGGADAANIASAASNPMVILWGLVLAAVVQLALMWIYLRRSERSRLLGLDTFGHMPTLRALGLALALIVTAMIFNFVYATYLIPGIGMQEEMAKMLAAIPRTPVNIAAGFFAIAIAAPLVEELLFRGLLQNALAKRMPIWGAIILSSLIFAAVHLQPYAIPGLMSLSIAFGYLYHRTGSLRMNILLHMVNNTVALSLTQAAV